MQALAVLELDLVGWTRERVADHADGVLAGADRTRVPRRLAVLLQVADALPVDLDVAPREIRLDPPLDRDRGGDTEHRGPAPVHGEDEEQRNCSHPQEAHAHGVYL